MGARGRAGFTLIELMVTVAIIGLGMTVIFFQLGYMLPGTRLQSACGKLASDMENLRLSAIMVYKVPIHLEYDLKKNAYRAYLPYEVDEEMNIIGPGETDLLDLQSLPEDIVFSDVTLGPKTQAVEKAEAVTVLIQPDGTITGHILHLKDIHTPSEEYSIRVASLTGFVEIFDTRVDYENLDQNAF